MALSWHWSGDYNIYFEGVFFSIEDDFEQLHQGAPGTGQDLSPYQRFVELHLCIDRRIIIKHFSLCDDNSNVNIILWSIYMNITVNIYILISSGKMKPDIFAPRNRQRQPPIENWRRHESQFNIVYSVDSTPFSWCLWCNETDEPFLTGLRRQGLRYALADWKDSMGLVLLWRIKK